MPSKTATRPSTAIIGAGLTGACVAGALAAAGQPVLVFDKGRGPGGRLSVRRTEFGDFAHGCPLPALRQVLATSKLAVAGLGQAADPGRSEAGSRALPRQLLGAAETRFGVEVARITRAKGLWRLSDAAGAVLGEAERLVLTAPAAQSATLLAEVQPDWSERLQAVRFHPNWSVLLALSESAAEPAWEAARPWLAKVQAQVQRPALESGDAPIRRWVAQLSDEASSEALEASPQHVLDALLARLGAVDAPWVYARAHRWRYARVVKPLPEAGLYSETDQLAVCGDAFAGGGADSDLGRCLISAQSLLRRWL